MRLTRRSILAALGGGLAMPFVRPFWAQSGTLDVYNWANYIGETTLQAIKSEFGVSANHGNYASAEEMQAKMLAGMTGYDVVFDAGTSLPRAIPPGFYDKLDRSQLTNWGNLDPEVLRIREGWDPGVQHSVPYMWGSMGFTFDVDLVKERLPDADLQDLSTVFDPANAEKLADCGISNLDSPDDIMLTVLRYLGIDGDTTDPADYEEVVAAFEPIRPSIRTFDNSSYLNAIPNGELCVINSWSGGAATAAPVPGLMPGQPVALAARPEKLTISRQRPEGSNVVPGRVEGVACFGKDSLYRVALPSGRVLSVSSVNARRTGEAGWVADWEDEGRPSFAPSAAILLLE